jgi:hypothetical protein
VTRYGIYGRKVGWNVKKLENTEEKKLKSEKIQKICKKK